METTDEVIVNEYLNSLVLNTLKSKRNIKKYPDCPVIYDYLSKSPLNSEITEKYLKLIRILNKQKYA